VLAEDWMKSVLGLTIPLENPLDALHRTPGFKVLLILIEFLSLGKKGKANPVTGNEGP
jgi:hypothetical protein